MLNEKKKSARTKPAELNTAPLPALKSGLSEDTVRQRAGSEPQFLLIRLTVHTFQDSHSRDGSIHRLATRAKYCISSL